MNALSPAMNDCRNRANLVLNLFSDQTDNTLKSFQGPGVKSCVDGAICKDTINVSLEFGSSDDAICSKVHKHKVGIRLFKDNPGMSFIPYQSRICRFNCSNKESSWTALAFQSLNSRILTLCLTVRRCCDMDCLKFTLS